MELNQLMQFKTIAECRTVSEAAEKLFVSQPALSTMLKKLEAELGVPLFNRTKNKLTLNEAGQLALHHARVILEQTDRMKSELSDYAKRDKLFRVGFCDPGPMWHCTPKFTMLFPNAELKSHIYTSEQDEISMLKDSHFDMLITSKNIVEEKIITIPFIHEQLYLSVKNTDKLASLPAISLRNGMVETIVLFRVGGAFEGQHSPLFEEIRKSTEIISYTDYFLFHQALQSCSAATITTRIVRNYRDDGNDRTLIPITDPEASFDYFATYKKENSARIQPLLNWVAICAQV